MVSAANIQQSAILKDSTLLLDFIYTDVTNGLTFFDSEEVLAVANLKAKNTGAPTVESVIPLDNQGTRVTKMLNNVNVNANAFVPMPTFVTVNRRSTISGTVPLQGRFASSDTITCMLRGVGSFETVTDSLFNLNDLDPGEFGI